MTQISWKQIDTNSNGYVDGNEATEAKDKGVANVWDYMMEKDFLNNTTRDQKLKYLKENIKYVGDSFILHDAFASNCSSEKDMLKELIESRKDEVLKYAALVEVLRAEAIEVKKEMTEKFGFLERLVYNMVTAYSFESITITKRHEEYYKYCSKLNDIAKTIFEYNDALAVSVEILNQTRGE